MVNFIMPVLFNYRIEINIIMEREEIKTLLATIEQQVSSSILGGMQEKYEELSMIGFITIHEDEAHPSATITQAGLDYLYDN